MSHRITFIILYILLFNPVGRVGSTLPENRPGVQLDLPDDPAAKASAIMDYIDDLWRGKSSVAEVTMEVKTENWSRTLEMKAWSLGKDYSLVRITAPKKEAGTATLKAENNIYNYLPKTDRTIKITSGMMMSSWMGSHFTNDDLVKESRYSEDYNCEVVFDGEREGEMVWEMQLNPKPDAPVIWGKIMFVIRQTDLMPVHAKYYDEKNILIRTMMFKEYKEMGARTIPSIMRLMPEDKPNEFTELTYNSIEFDIGLEPSFFSIRNLKN
ncbi:outer membrane lipoprotein-sorting protein [bacterium]|nr:outer membrane lipoprotein-sorting protein [candidate division CSSED10-310 bacterium]